MTAIVVSDVTLPSGWEVEDLGSDQIVIKAPGPLGGYVTVDFRARGFRAGWVASGRLLSNGTYRGKGWRKALTAAAIRWLDNVVADRGG